MENIVWLLFVHFFLGVLFTAFMVRRYSVVTTSFRAGLTVLCWPLIFPYWLIVCIGKIAEKVADL